MSFDVRITPDAEQDAEEILDWLIEQHAGETGARWSLRMSEAVESLAELPRRCKLAPEDASSPYEVRELLYGDKPHLYRLLFTIENEVVYVLHVRHGRILPLTRA